MKKKIMVLTVAGALASAAAAQNQYDALRFLGNDVNGTARFVGMGGAMSSLGADLSTIGTNPAGIGLYRSNDVALSFGFNANKSHSDFNGSVMDESRNRASFDQVGFVWSGIATRNGMLLISHYNDLKLQGVTLHKRIINGSVDRLNPILMTALSSALALIPLAVGGSLPGNEIQSPMAKVILGGLFTSTLLNAFIVPIVYEMTNKKGEEK